MPGHPLADVVVLELATGVAGPYAGRLLADLGALVIKVEPPGGDPARTEIPLVDGESAFYAWLNAAKPNVAASTESDDFLRLAANADIVLHSARGAEANALEHRLTAANAHAVVISLSPYGRSGPRAGWEWTPYTEWATGGFQYIAGDPAREPLALPGYQAQFHTATLAGVAALAGLRHARATGEGQRIEMSHQEATLSCHAWLTTSWTHGGQVQMRTGSAFIPCADGFIYLFGLAAYQNLLLLIERFDLLADETLFDPPNWWARLPEIQAALAEWAATRTRHEIYHMAQELRIAISPINTMADVAKSDQLAARGSLATIALAGREFVAPGVPYRMTETPAGVSGGASASGADTGRILSPAFEWPNRGVTYPPRAHGEPAAGPLAGLRVIEVTANWAGPAAGRNFADLGADVIKVELATKPATRSLSWVGNDRTWPRHYDRAAYFNKLNRNKRDLCLDLSKPAGRQVFLDLVAVSDVVIENNGARVMGQLGVAYDTLRTVNPKLVMCSMSGYGATGPERNYSAYGSNIETASGLASLLGYGPGEYFGTGTFYADPVTGNHGTVAVLAALHLARQTGQGQWIDMALLEAALPFFAQQFLQYTVTGEVPVPMGNRSPVFAPQGAYRAAGTDCWLALSVRDERDWAALCRVIGRQDMAASPAFASAEGRRAAHDAIDAAIAAWSAPLDHIHAANLLQAAGIPAAPVMPNWEIVSDNHLNDRGFFVPVRHPEAGTFPYPGFAWRFERTPARIFRPAPMFAEHNHEVLGGLLGLSADAVAALYDAGVTADAPIFAASTSL